MRILFCGVRGSTPAPGFAFARHGGNTSCVALSHDGDLDPTLVLDAGTGLSRLGRELDGRAFNGSILLGHLHWDHTHGIPFFPGGDHPEARVDVYLPEQGDASEVLARVLSPPHFPITPNELIGKWTFHGLEPGTHRIEGFDVLAREIPHTGGRTYGFRVTDGRASIAYLSDHSPIALGQGPRGVGEFHEAAMELASGADVLVHDAQYTANEFATRAHYGHSTMDYAIELGERAGVGKVVLFHHDPARTDDQLDAVVEVNQHHHVRVIAATEGMTLDLRGR